MIFKNIKELQTQRLTLSLISEEDANIIYDLRSNAEVQKYIDREPFKKHEQAETQLKKVLGLLDNQESVTWIIKLSSESKKVGSICLWNFSKDRKIAEVGYDLLPDFHNKGIMSEALEVVLDVGFQKLQLKTVEAFTSKYNKGSISLLEKHNFEYQKDRFDEGFPNNNIYTLSF
ncbi:GNAT family N-acetyltransferase [Bizionia arctica]|uniref:GNAT family N-acetyltransferase n=1 Tax=Bizionia arctica TaxID=1495645 RepID=A0A917LJU0_9FLAO|nr:GNAT family N-acetyltransferase [Bizionia arctica]GGG33669.1 GNAT family N-acetyltransferase [Bizionia arctica]